MKLKRTSILIAVLLFASLLAPAQQTLEPSASRLQQHVSYLASDALEGRRTGTAGANDAARDMNVLTGKILSYLSVQDAWEMRRNKQAACRPHDWARRPFEGLFCRRCGKTPG